MAPVSYPRYQLSTMSRPAPHNLSSHERQAEGSLKRAGKEATRTIFVIYDYSYHNVSAVSSICWRDRQLARLSLICH